MAPGAGVRAAAASAAAAPPQPALQVLREFQQIQETRAELYARFSQGFREFLDHGQEGVFVRLMQALTPAFNSASQQVIQLEAHLRSAGRPDLADLLRRVQEQERSKLEMTLTWQALRTAHAAGRFSWQVEADRPRLQGASSDAAQQQQQQLLALMERVRLAADGGGDGNDVGGGRGGVAVSDQGLRLQPPGQACGLVSVKPGFYEQQLARAVAAVEAAAEARAEPAAAAAAAAAAPSPASGGCCGHAHGEAHALAHGGGPADPLEPNGLEPTEAEYTAAVREALRSLDGCVGAINELLQEVRDAAEELEGQE